jgi:hypothetical protein
MSRAVNAGSIGHVHYEFAEETLRDEAARMILYQDISLALPKQSLIRQVDVMLYVKCVLNKVDDLTDVDNNPVIFPDAAESIDVHLKAFDKFVNVRLSVAVHLLKAWDIANAPTAPREILPTEQLTDEEKNNPDFLVAATVSKNA